jgi:hypothetical protein
MEISEIAAKFNQTEPPFPKQTDPHFAGVKLHNSDQISSSIAA